MHCRINRNRLWANRMMLESYKHGESCFLTLTYDGDNIPTGGTLVRKDVQLFLKRLRKKFTGHTIRYYAVGEYGEQSERPHYHIALYGLGRSFESIFGECWNKGIVHCGDLTIHSAQYIAKYIQKGRTRKDEFTAAFLRGREPEFALMSLKPGIGALAVPELAKAYTTRAGSLAVSRNGDVPDTILTGKSQMPLGRYLKEKIREEIGLEPGWQEIPKARYQAEMQALRNEVGEVAFKTQKPFVNWKKIAKREMNRLMYPKKGKL